MSISRVQRLETTRHWQWNLLIVGILFVYISFLAGLIITKKHEFFPFEEVKDNYLQIDPFQGHIVKAAREEISGKGVVVRLNTLCNSLIQPSPEFNYLVFSRNILGDMCARNPSEVNFVAYIKYEKHMKRLNKSGNKVIYTLSKKVAVINWPSKELVAQKIFQKDYTFVRNYNGLESAVDKRLCSISEEPSDEEVKNWIASLVISDNYYY